MHVSVFSHSASLHRFKENFRGLGFHLEPFNIVLCTLIDFIKKLHINIHIDSGPGLVPKCVSLEKTGFYSL